MARKSIGDSSRIAGLVLLAATVTAISAIPAAAQGYNPLNPWGSNGPLGGNRGGGSQGGSILSPYVPPQNAGGGARSGAILSAPASNYFPSMPFGYQPYFRGWGNGPAYNGGWRNYTSIPPVTASPDRANTLPNVNRQGQAESDAEHRRQRNSNPLNAYVPPASATDGHRRHRHDFDDSFVYAGGGVTVVTDGPALLGGYYYGNYCATQWNNSCYPAVFSDYSGFPQYIYSPGLVVLAQPYIPAYTTPYIPFYAPPYQVTYNEINYYVDTDHTANEIEQGGAPAKKALGEAFPSDSYEAAFADIEKAWNDGNLSLLRKHLRDSDTKIAVSLKSKYRYSIASDDFEQIAKDAFDRLNTVSFKFKGLRKAKNGDVTAYAVHVYRSGDGSSDDGAVVPFDTDKPNAEGQDDGSGPEHTVYVSYTLREHDDLWYIIAVDSSTTPLISNLGEAAS